MAKTPKPAITVRRKRIAHKRQKRLPEKCPTIVEEVEKFEDLAPRMLELQENCPEGTRIYLRVRNPVTIH